MSVDDAIFERIKGDIESKYKGFKHFEDLRKWIRDLPEYYKEFGSKLEPFIIKVLMKLGPQYLVPKILFINSTI